MTTARAGYQAVLPARRLPHPSVKHLLVLDDYVTLADAIASRLDSEPGVRAFAATTIEQARWVMSGRLFDGLLLDLDLDGHSGLRFAAEALDAQPDLRIVVVTGSTDDRHVIDAVRIGIFGWVPKDEPIEHLLEVIHGALRGETWIPPRLLTRVIAELRSAQRDVTERDILLGKLTQREQEVLCLLVTGMSVDAIAGQLFLSRNTVRTHVQNITRKLSVHSAVAAVAVARRAGLRGPNLPVGDSEERCGQEY
jgi:DNA-binding NarL/FixJ family response regulator